MTTVKKVFKPSRVITPISDEFKTKYKIVSNGQRPRYARVLLSALGGVGKTSIIGTASRRVLLNDEWTIPHNNVLLLEYDPDGDDTLFSMGAEVDRIQSPSERILLDVLKACATSKEFDQYDTIAIDAYNRLQDIELDTILPEGVRLSATRKHARIDPEVMEIQDYGKLNKRTRVINDALHAIKKHIIVTCILGMKDHPLDAHIKKKEDRRQVISLALDGRQAHTLSTQFSLHGIMTKEGAGTNLLVKTQFSLYNSESKTRFRMDHDHDNITFPKILELIGINDPAFKKINWAHDYKGFLPELVGTNGN